MTDLSGGQGVLSGNHHVQWNVWFGGRRIDAAMLEALSATAAADLVAKLPQSEAAQALAAMRVPPAAKAAWVLLHRDEALAVSLLGTMNPDHSRSVVAELTATFDWLEGLPDAAAAIEQVDVVHATALGASAGPLTPVSSWAIHGFRRRYEHGEIRWSPKGSAQIIPASYLALHEDRLGFPLSPVTPAKVPDGSVTTGEFQRYQGGIVVSSAAHGTHAVWGGIGEHYDQVGGTASRLGFPVSGEATAGPSRAGGGITGWCQRFEGGAVYWSERTGAVEVRPDIGGYHDGRGGVTGALGFPAGATLAAGASPFGTTGEFQRFEGTYDYPSEILDRWTPEEGVGGCTVYVSEHGIHAVGAGIGELYEGINGTSSWLGFPTSGEIDARAEPDEEWCCYATFEGGAIYWKDAHGAVAVSRVVADLLAGDAGLTRRLGFPVTAERPMLHDVDDGVQYFEHGVVTVRDGVAEAWVRP
ncbi:hypothetical protein AB0J72_40465 [Dactylosporangium sp. NPDC049742]|uniref:LGFP repeat-containing protein n=1 Tax=Dactylosporangium sp. NPDC049742 TaxID=3154737 RepID=UPI003424CE26